MGKFRNIHFVGDLTPSTCCEFYYDDVTVSDVIYKQVIAALPLKASHGTAYCYSFSVFCGQKDLAQIPATSRCVQCRPILYSDKCFTRPAIHVGVKCLWSRKCC